MQILHLKQAKVDAASTYETITNATNTFETKADAASTYETIANANATFYKLNSTAVFTGVSLSGDGSGVSAGNTSMGYYKHVATADGLVISTPNVVVPICNITVEASGAYIVSYVVNILSVTGTISSVTVYPYKSSNANSNPFAISGGITPSYVDPNFGPISTSGTNTFYYYKTVNAGSGELDLNLTINGSLDATVTLAVSYMSIIKIQ